MMKPTESSYIMMKKQQTLKGSITSIALRGEGHQFYVGTSHSEISR